MGKHLPSMSRCRLGFVSSRPRRYIGCELPWSLAPIMGASLSTDLDDDTAVPYFLWDEPMTVAALRQRLADASHPERCRLLGKILREARDTDVWRFTDLREVQALWPDISRHLGRRRPFWEFLFAAWKAERLL